MRLALEAIDARTKVIALHGELVGGHAQQLLEVASEQSRLGARRVIVDLSETTFVDSTGLAALLSTGRLLATEYTAVALVVPTEAAVRRMLDIQGVTDLFVITPTRSAAVAALDRTA